MSNPEDLKQDLNLMDGCESPGQETSLSKSTLRTDITEPELATEEASKTLSTSDELKFNIIVPEHSQITLPTSGHEISADSHTKTELSNNIPRSPEHDSQLLNKIESPSAHFDQMLPSFMTDEHYIFCNNSSRILADSSKIGKWLLFCDIRNRSPENNMTDLDQAWLKTTDLIKSTKLPIIRAKCSTAANIQDSPLRSRPHGIIMFYTPDFTNKAEVRSIAEEIYQKIGKMEDSASTLFEMFYKTDEASRQGEYVYHQKKTISTYSFRNGAFFERDVNSHEWKLVPGFSNSNSSPYGKQGSPFKRSFAKR